MKKPTLEFLVILPLILGSFFVNKYIVSDCDARIERMSQSAYDLAATGYYLSCLKSVAEVIGIGQIEGKKLKGIDQDNLVELCKQRAQEFRQVVSTIEIKPGK